MPEEYDDYEEFEPDDPDAWEDYCDGETWSDLDEEDD